MNVIDKVYSRYKYYSGNKDNIVKTLKKVLGEEKQILLAILFGSFIELESYRDIDIAIYTFKEDFTYYAKLSAKLELILKIPIDIVPLDQVSTRFRYKILTKGLIIVEKTAGLYEAILNQTYDELKYLQYFT